MDENDLLFFTGKIDISFFIYRLDRLLDEEKIFFFQDGQDDCVFFKYEHPDVIVVDGSKIYFIELTKGSKIDTSYYKISQRYRLAREDFYKNIFNPGFANGSVVNQRAKLKNTMTIDKHYHPVFYPVYHLSGKEKEYHQKCEELYKKLSHGQKKIYCKYYGYPFNEPEPELNPVNDFAFIRNNLGKKEMIGVDDICVMSDAYFEEEEFDFKIKKFDFNSYYKKDEGEHKNNDFDISLKKVDTKMRENLGLHQPEEIAQPAIRINDSDLKHELDHYNICYIIDSLVKFEKEMLGADYKMKENLKKVLLYFRIVSLLFFDDRGPHSYSYGSGADFRVFFSLNVDLVINKLIAEVSSQPFQQDKKIEVNFLFDINYLSFNESDRGVKISKNQTDVIFNDVDVYKYYDKFENIGSVDEKKLNEKGKKQKEEFFKTTNPGYFPDNDMEPLYFKSNEGRYDESSILKYFPRKIIFSVVNFKNIRSDKKIETFFNIDVIRLQDGSNIDNYLVPTNMCEFIDRINYLSSVDNQQFVSEFNNTKFEKYIPLFYNVKQNSVEQFDLHNHLQKHNTTLKSSLQDIIKKCNSNKNSCRVELFLIIVKKIDGLKNINLLENMIEYDPLAEKSMREIYKIFYLLTYDKDSNILRNDIGTKDADKAKNNRLASMGILVKEKRIVAPTTHRLMEQRYVLRFFDNLLRKSVPEFDLIPIRDRAPKKKSVLITRIRDDYEVFSALIILFINLLIQDPKFGNITFRHAKSDKINKDSLSENPFLKIEREFTLESFYWNRGMESRINRFFYPKDDVNSRILKSNFFDFELTVNNDGTMTRTDGMYVADVDFSGVYFAKDSGEYEVYYFENGPTTNIKYDGTNFRINDEYTVINNCDKELYKWVNEIPYAYCCEKKDGKKYIVVISNINEMPKAYFIGVNDKYQSLHFDDSKSFKAYFELWSNSKKNFYHTKYLISLAKIFDVESDDCYYHYYIKNSDKIKNLRNIYFDDVLVENFTYEPYQHNNILEEILKIGGTKNAELQTIEVKKIFMEPTAGNAINREAPNVFNSKVKACDKYDNIDKKLRKKSHKKTNYTAYEIDSGSFNYVKNYHNTYFDEILSKGYQIKGFGRKTHEYDINKKYAKIIYYYELANDLILRPSQIIALENMIKHLVCDGLSSTYYQLIMAFGKTKVLIPLIALILWFGYDKKKIMIVQPQDLVDQTFDTVCQKIVSIAYIPMFKDKTGDENGIYILSDHILKSDIVMEKFKGGDEWTVIFDEVDNMANNIKSELNIDVSNQNKKKIKMLQERTKYMVSLIDKTIDFCEKNPGTDIEKIREGEYVVKNSTKLKELLGKEVNYPGQCGNGNEEKYIKNKLINKVIPCIFRKIHLLDYGLNPDAEKNYWNIAIPFTASNRPSEESQFTDVDYCIGYSLLSYRYSNIKNSKIQELFFRLLLRYKYETIKGANKSTKKRLIDQLTIGSNLDASDFDLKERKKTEDYMKEVLEKKQFIVTYNLAKFFMWEIIENYFNFQTRIKNISFIDVISNNIFKNKIGMTGTPFILPFKDIGKSMCDIKYQVDASSAILRNITNKPLELLKEGKDQYEAVIDYFVKNVKKYNCIIDVGSYLVSRKAVDIAEDLKNRTGKDVIYVDTDNKIYKYDGRSHKNFDKKERTTVDEIVLFDQNNTVGVDLQVYEKACGLVTINFQCDFTNVSQAVYRLRGIGNGQTVEFCSFDEINDELSKILIERLVKGMDQKKYYYILQCLLTYLRYGNNNYEIDVNEELIDGNSIMDDELSFDYFDWTLKMIKGKGEPLDQNILGLYNEMMTKALNFKKDTLLIEDSRVATNTSTKDNTTTAINISEYTKEKEDQSVIIKNGTQNDIYNKKFDVVEENNILVLELESIKAKRINDSNLLPGGVFKEDDSQTKKLNYMENNITGMYISPLLFVVHDSYTESLFPIDGFHFVEHNNKIYLMTHFETSKIMKKSDLFAKCKIMDSRGISLRDVNFKIEDKKYVIAKIIMMAKVYTVEDYKCINSLSPNEKNILLEQVKMYSKFKKDKESFYFYYIIIMELFENNYDDTELSSFFNKIGCVDEKNVCSGNNKLYDAIKKNVIDTYKVTEYDIDNHIKYYFKTYEIPCPKG